MAKSKLTGRQRREAQQTRRRAQRRNKAVTYWVGGIVLVGVAAAILFLTGQQAPAYSEMDAIGQRPALVQVYLPG